MTLLCRSNSPLRLHNDLTDHTLYFVKSADIAVRAGLPEGVFIIVGWIQDSGVKWLPRLLAVQHLVDSSLEKDRRLPCVLRAKSSSDDRLAGLDFNNCWLKHQQ